MIGTLAWLAHVGFVGISDDDASRALIAWDFSRHPSIDPTRSSWLPVPTYVLGTALAITRALRITPRVVSLLAALATWAGGVALARRVGAPPRAALVGATLAWLFPWTLFSAWAIGVPEMLCAACTVWGLERALAGTRRSIALGAVLFTLACGCRYEAWLVAAAAALAVWWEARGHRLATALCLAPTALVPVAWLCINARYRGSATDFLHRSAHYYAQRPDPDAYPTLVVASIGVLVATALVLSIGARGRRAVPFAAFALLVGLAVMERAGDGATHHRARTLLLAVWLLAPWCAARLAHRPATGVLLALACAAQFGIHARNVPHDVSLDAVAAGRRLADETTPYAIETGRLDFLWVEWASDHPERAQPDHPFGGADPPLDVTADRFARLPVAAVSSPALADALVARGWHVVFASTTWRVLAQRGSTLAGATDVSSRSRISQSSM